MVAVAKLLRDAWEVATCCVQVRAIRVMGLHGRMFAVIGINVAFFENGYSNYGGYTTNNQC